MNKAEYRGYRKTWYRRFYFKWQLKVTPPNWIEFHPVKIFGFQIGWMMKLAKSNYPWQKN